MKLMVDIQVRCSGEKTGCRRCQELGYDCIYVESMVGRTRGRQGRSNSNNVCRQKSNSLQRDPFSQVNFFTNRMETQENQHNSHWSPLPVLPEGQSSVCSDFDFVRHDSMSEQTQGDGYNDTGIGPDILDDPCLNFFSDQTDHLNSYLQMTQSEVVDTVCTTSLIEVAKPKTPLQEPGERLPGSLNIRDPTNNPSHVHKAITPPISPMATIGPNQEVVTASWKDMVPSSLEFSLPCNQLSPRAQTIMACASILSCVEELCECTHALDESLRINKESMHKISSLIGSACFRESPGSMVVLVQGLQQIVGMLEKNCIGLYPGLRRDASRLVSGEPHEKEVPLGKKQMTHAAHINVMPAIGFGCFNIEPEEQQAIQATIISRELTRTMDVIKSLSNRLGYFNKESRADMEFTRQSLKDLEQRIEHMDLCVKFKK